MYRVIFVFLVTIICSVLNKPSKSSEYVVKSERSLQPHILWKRFINPSLTIGGFTDNTFSKIRTRRSTEEECEKLSLCKLHAQASHSFFAAYELYFVNKENAKLWDHKARTAAACERRYSGCSAKPAPQPQSPSRSRNYVRRDYYDYDY